MQQVHTTARTGQKRAKSSERTGAARKPGSEEQDQQGDGRTHRSRSNAEACEPVRPERGQEGVRDDGDQICVVHGYVQEHSETAAMLTKAQGPEIIKWYESTGHSL